MKAQLQARFSRILIEGVKGKENIREKLVLWMMGVLTLMVGAGAIFLKLIGKLCGCF